MICDPRWSMFFIGVVGSTFLLLLTGHLDTTSYDFCNPYDPQAANTPFRDSLTISAVTVLPETGGNLVSGSWDTVSSAINYEINVTGPDTTDLFHDKTLTGTSDTNARVDQRSSCNVRVRYPAVVEYQGETETAWSLWSQRSSNEGGGTGVIPFGVTVDNYVLVYQNDTQVQLITSASDLTGLEQLTSPAILDLSDTVVSDLDGTYVTDISVVANFPELYPLEFVDTSVSDMTVLTNHPAINTIWTPRSGVTDPTPIFTAAMLRQLNLYELNGLTSIAGVDGFTSVSTPESVDLENSWHSRRTRFGDRDRFRRSLRVSDGSSRRHNVCIVSLGNCKGGTFIVRMHGRSNPSCNHHAV